MAQFLDSIGCRRVELGRFIDSIAGDCKEVGRVLYDQYKGEEEEGEEEEDASQGRLGRWQMAESRKVAVLQEWL